MIIYSRKKDESYSIIGSFYGRGAEPAQVEILVDDGSSKFEGTFTLGDAKHLLDKLVNSGKATAQRYEIVAIVPPAKS